MNAKSSDRRRCAIRVVNIRPDWSSLLHMLSSSWQDDIRRSVMSIFHLSSTDFCYENLRVCSGIILSFDS